MSSIMYNIKCLQPLLIFFIFEPPYLALNLLLTHNPLRAKFFIGNTNMYLHFVPILHIHATQVVEILLQIRQEPTYST